MPAGQRRRSQEARDTINDYYSHLVFRVSLLPLLRNLKPLVVTFQKEELFLVIRKVFTLSSVLITFSTPSTPTPPYGSLVRPSSTWNTQDHIWGLLLQPAWEQRGGFSTARRKVQTHRAAGENCNNATHLRDSGLKTRKTFFFYFADKMKMLLLAKQEERRKGKS